MTEPIAKIEWGEPNVKTGWNCLVCCDNASISYQGDTWCWKHWKEWDLGDGKTIRQMLDEHNRL